MISDVGVGEYCLQLIRNVVYFLAGYDVRRGYTQRVVSARSDDHAETEHFSRHRRDADALVQLNAAQKTFAAYVENELVPRELARKLIGEVVARFGDAFEQSALLQFADDDVRRRAGEGIAAESGAVVARSENFRRVSARQTARDGNAAAQPFCEGDYIRLNAVVLEAEELARSARARLHFVENEK